MLAEARRCPQCGDQITVIPGFAWWDETGQTQAFVYKCFRCSRENGVDHTYGYDESNRLISVDAFPVEDYSC